MEENSYSTSSKQFWTRYRLRFILYVQEDKDYLPPQQLSTTETNGKFSLIRKYIKEAPYSGMILLSNLEKQRGAVAALKNNIVKH